MIVLAMYVTYFGSTYRISTCNSLFFLEFSGPSVSDPALRPELPESD